MVRYPKLKPGRYYHLFNRGNNREALFRERRNYAYFLDRYAYYMEPVAVTLAYCLMPNHFHLFVCVKDQGNGERSPSAALSNLFNSYARTINHTYGRRGSLFQKRFRRIEVDTERYATCLVRYIHQNPQHHGFVEDFRTYPHSSYRSLLSAGTTRLNRQRVLSWFGGRESFEHAHQTNLDLDDMRSVVDEDFESSL